MWPFAFFRRAGQHQHVAKSVTFTRGGTCARTPKKSCADKTVIDANIESVRIAYKTLQEIFKPDFYVLNEVLKWAITERGEN